MKTLSYIFTAFKDAFSLRFLIPCLLLMALGGTVIFADVFPFFFWSSALLLVCLWVGYLVEMLRSYQSDNPFYPHLSYILIWIGGKAILLLLVVGFIYGGIFFLTHPSLPIDQIQAYFAKRSSWISLLEFFLFLPFLYQFVTSLSFIQFFNLKKVFLIFKRYFLTFIGLFFQLAIVLFFEILVFAAIYVPLFLWLVHSGYNFLQTPFLLFILINQFSSYAICLAIISVLIGFYFSCVKTSLIGQAFARIAQQEREKYEALHPVVHPEPISSFSRHYTIEEPEG